MVYFISYILNSIILLISVICSIYFGVVFGSNNEFAVIFTIVGIFSFLLAVSLTYVNYGINIYNNFRVFPMKKFILLMKNLDSDNKELKFIYKNKGYELISEPNIRFDLKTCFLKKSFVIAFVVRNVRYNIVSNNLKLYNLFRKTLKIKIYKNLKISFEKNGRIREYKIVKNGISKFTFLSQFLTLINIPFKRRRYTAPPSLFEIVKVDENTYCCFNPSIIGYTIPKNKKKYINGSIKPE